MCRSWSQIEPNLALASQGHGFVMICDVHFATCTFETCTLHFILRVSTCLCSKRILLRGL